MAHLSYLQSWSSSDRPSLPVILTGLVIIAYVCDVLLGWLMLRRGTQLPLAGLPNAVPKFVHSFNYATNATSLFQQSYTKVNMPSALRPLPASDENKIIPVQKQGLQGLQKRWSDCATTAISS